MIEWTTKLDNQLLAAKREGLSASQTAKRLGSGFTRNMVIARHNRLRGVIFPSDADRRDRALEEAAERKRLRDEWVSSQWAEMDRQAHKNIPRDSIIAIARRAGMTLEDIGHWAGLTRERVRQICDDRGVPPARGVAA